MQNFDGKARIKTTFGLHQQDFTVDLRPVEWKGLVWIRLLEGRDKFWTSVKAVMDFPFHKTLIFFISLTNIGLSRNFLRRSGWVVEWLSGWYKEDYVMLVGFWGWVFGVFLCGRLALYVTQNWILWNLLKDFKYNKEWQTANTCISKIYDIYFPLSGVKYA